MISDLQLASAITGVVRLVGRSQDAVLSEIAETPVIDQREVDAAIDEALSDEATAPPAEDDDRARRRGLSRRGKDALDRVDRLTDAPTPTAERISRAASKENVRSALGAAKGYAQPLTSAALNVVRGDVYPGHDQWTSPALTQRAGWWAQRVGTLIGAVAAGPALTGSGAKMVKVTPLMGCAAQAVTVCVVAREGQVGDDARTVDLVSRVVFDRPLSPDAIDSATRAPVTAMGDLTAADVEIASLRNLGAVGAVRQVRVIRNAMESLQDVDLLLDGRPQGGWALRTMSNIPVAGAAATFAIERAGVRKVAEETVRLLG
jgi:hypothetical protein